MTEHSSNSKPRRRIEGIPLAIGMDPADIDALRRACEQLEHPSLAARLSSVVGTPIELGLRLLPKSWYKRLHQVAEASIEKAFTTAISSMRRERELGPHETFYKALAAGSGAVGGLVGLPGLLVELPITTTLMLRAIAEIARDHGEDVNDLECRAACLEVFALGGRTEVDDAAETGYYGVRLALATYMRAVTAHAAHHGVQGGGAPLLVQLIRAVSSRFGADLSTRAATRVLPVVGAAGAAAVNLIFMQHFQDMARGHFAVRRLERRYGKALVRSNYELLAREL